MNTKTSQELRETAENRGLTAFRRFQKAGLVALLETPERPPRSTRPRKAAKPATIVPTPKPAPANLPMVYELTHREYKHTLHRTFRSFRIPGINKANGDGYIGMVRSGVKALIENKVKDILQDAAVHVSLIQLDPEDMEEEAEEHPEEYTRMDSFC